MQKHSTDHIAQMTFKALKQEWKAFLAIPILFYVISTPLSVWALESLPRNYEGWIGFGIGIFHLVFFISFITATTKWAESLYKKKKIDLDAGLRYGLSRFMKVIGTGLLTFIKILLWMLLLILPGFYKAIQYSLSIKVSQLEDFSISQSNQVSQKMIMNSGFLRTLGNISAIYSLTLVLSYLCMLLTFIGLASLIGFINAAESLEEMATVSGIFIMITWVILGTVFSMFFYTFLSFQYLVYRDENKSELSKLRKAIAK